MSDQETISQNVESGLPADFQWTTGKDDNTTHISLIDRGAYGEVHQVATTNYWELTSWRWWTGKKKPLGSPSWTLIFFRSLQESW